ncbi:MAG: right-handed parallel beta-helix repeat-containing protein [Chloroflexales bacterium]|nr:right-handed parallel beta-helix repeat-containing protein [Chloroflexales bacterium]
MHKTDRAPLPQTKRAIRAALALLTLLALLPALPLPAAIQQAAAKLPGAASVAQAAPGDPDPVCELLPTDPRNYPITLADARSGSGSGAITGLRRQPFQGTTALTPTVSYDAGLKTFTLSRGRLTMPQLRDLITSTFSGTAQMTATRNLLVESAPGTWLLSANLTIGEDAALSVIGSAAAGAANWLQVKSTAAITPPLVITNYGYVVFRNSKLTSWDTTKNAVDTYYQDGRAYYLTFEGGRTDFYASEAAFLGYKDGEASGVAWRKCADNTNAVTGATGDIHDSDFHDNLFGMYSYQAYGIWAKNTRMHNNVLYGFDPHDYSDFFIFENNQVYDNGKHGIIFSRWCEKNIIRNNTVYNSHNHGIMLDRRTNYNFIVNNVVRNNQDGIAIFQSTDNVIAANNVYDNLTGLRINATPVPPTNGIPDRTPDQPSLRNQVLNNTFANNQNYGVYFYNRADSNTIKGNTISGNGRYDSQPSIVSYGSGVQVKTGGNTIENNTLANNGNGVSALELSTDSDPVGGGDNPNQIAAATPSAVEPGLPSGSQNIVRNNQITGSKGRGLRLRGIASGKGVNNNLVELNTITGSGDEAIYLDTGNDNRITDNIIHDNGLPKLGSVDEGIPDQGNYGVVIKGVFSAKDVPVSYPARNRVQRNLIYRNGREAIKLGTNVNYDIDAPKVISVQAAQILGTAPPLATVDVYRDIKACPAGELGTACGDEAREFVATDQADGQGNWSVNANVDGLYNYTAQATDSVGNSSELSRQAKAPVVSIGIGRKGEKVIFVDGTNSELTLAAIQQLLITRFGVDTTKTLLTNDGAVDDGGVSKNAWTLKASLNISPNVTLRLLGGGKGSAIDGDNKRVDWLRLRSDPGRPGFPKPDPNDPENPIFDYDAYVTIKSFSGNIVIEDTKITAWDTTQNTLDTNYQDGRAFVLAKYNAEMLIINSDMSYLGYPDGEAYGVSWRDVDSTTSPTKCGPIGSKCLRVTGGAINSTFSHNYYGIYTFQAHNMTFVSNQLFSNIQYGFDPHDFTNDVLVENNSAYDNGSHGFIISRGCTNFIFRNNRSYSNKVKPGSKNPSAHGFMLDPGAPEEKSGVPQVPSTDNLFEFNEAYDNDGYGMRIYGSNNNVLRNNLFERNRTGVTIEAGSTGNTLDGNVIRRQTGELVIDTVTLSTTIKGGHGIYIFQGADANIVVGNTVSNNANVGIYIKTAGNLVQGNRVRENAADGIGTLLETTSDVEPPEPDTLAVNDPLAPGAYIGDAEPGLWSVGRATVPMANQFISNTVQSNLQAGISLKSAEQTLISGNTIISNTLDGLYMASGSDTSMVSGNAISGNGGYGIKLNGADVLAIVLSRNAITGNTVGAIAVTNGANGNPTLPLLRLGSDGSVSGKVTPGATLEFFSDDGRQAAFYEGTVTSGSDGTFRFTPERPPSGKNITATLTDSGKNTSGLSKVAKRGSDLYLPLIIKP